MKSLAKKIAAVIAAVKSPPKTGTHDYLKFAYSTRDDIFGVIRGELADQGVAAIPSVELISSEEAAKGQTRSLVRVTVMLIDADSDETLTQSWVGEAITKDDKGIQGAATQAIRFWAVNTFMLCDGSDEELHAGKTTDNHQVTRKAVAPAPLQGIGDRLKALGFSDDECKAFGKGLAAKEGTQSIKDVSESRLRAWYDAMVSKEDDAARESVNKTILAADEKAA